MLFLYMECVKKMPIGIDIFEKVDWDEFYYVDKTGMIED